MTAALNIYTWENVLNANMKRVLLPTENCIMFIAQPYKSTAPWSKRFSVVQISAVLLHITKGFTNHLWPVNVTLSNPAIVTTRMRSYVQGFPEPLCFIFLSQVTNVEERGPHLDAATKQYSQSEPHILGRKPLEIPWNLPILWHML